MCVRKLPKQKSSLPPRQQRQKISCWRGWCGSRLSLCVVKWPARWEPQEEGMMSIAASFPSVKKPRFNIDQERRDNDDWRWCSLVCDINGQFIYGASSKLCVLAAMWNLHTHKQILCSQLTMRLSISLVCLKQRLWVYRVENSNSMRVK
jgi:hypothetical protein